MKIVDQNTTYQKQADLLQKAYWRINEFKQFFELGTTKAIKLKKEVRKYCYENEIRLLDNNRIQTSIIIEYFNIDVSFIYKMVKKSKQS